MHFLRQVKTGVWQLAFWLPFSTNCWFVEEDDGLTLIDTAYPGCGPTIVRSADRIGRPIRRIVITHAHPDHAGAMAWVWRQTGAAVMAHAADVPFLEGRRSLATEPGFWLCRALLEAGRRLGITDAVPVPVVEPLQETHTVGRLEVLHSPGHTPGHLSLWEPESRAMFCGDNLAYTFWALHLGVPWYTLNIPQRNASVARYAEFPIDLLLAGHGPVMPRNVVQELKRVLTRGY